MLRQTSRSFLWLGLALCLVATPAGAADQLSKSVKKDCADIKKQLKESDKRLAELRKEIEKYDQQFNEAKARFQSYQSKHSSMAGCSRGNPGNSAECIQVLAGLQQSGDDMTRIEQQRLVPTRQKNAVENDRLTPKLNQKLLNCPQ